MSGKIVLLGPGPDDPNNTLEAHRRAGPRRGDKLRRRLAARG